MFNGCKKANCVLGMIKTYIICKNAAIIMRPWCDVDCSIAHRLGLLIIRRILRFWKEYKNGLQKWFMDMGT